MYLKVIVFLCYFRFVLVSSNDELVSKIVAKRSDIDLQTCIENFDVHKDKIIRTQDSKDMGAKYINEIDLGSREECLRLCCETENCDVFVFEEKNSGSCYLFECGPPEDFKCKFTHHANYSSAILAVNRHLPDLESQIKLTKHEQELAKLSYRKQELAMEMKKKTEAVKTTIATTTVTEIKILPVAPTKAIIEESKEIKCSRYQFECRSTKECIAIYNACDGIPQCADGSDEGPELGCPETGTTPVTTRIRPNPVYEEGSITQNRPIPPQPYPNVPSPKLYQSQLRQREPSTLQVLNSQRLDPDFIKSDSRTAYIPHSPAYEAPRPPSYPQIPSQVQANWIPHQANQVPQQYPQYEDRSSHIFNHKENGLQASEGQDISQLQFGDINPRENTKIGSYLEDMYRQNPVFQEKWSKTNSDNQFNNKNQYTPEVNQQPIENWPQRNVIPNTADNERVQNYNKAPSEQMLAWKTEKHIEEHQERQKIAHELKHSKDLMENVVKIPELKQIKIEKIEKHEHPQYSATVAKYKMTEVVDLQDGITETPGGAILSLTLGIIITCVMALLIGCRLRVVRRRIRRGGKSYAHDADYLVNGMYL